MPTRRPTPAPPSSAIPEILAVKSIFLDLAYEEYCRRRERGEVVDPKEFCARFPRHRSALLRLIDAHLYLSAHPELLAGGLPGPWPVTGDVVAGFTIVRELGCGAFARVYLATEASAGDRPVALKLTLEGGAEACILGRLTHRNIVHVNSAGDDEETGLTRLCMPFLGAATLQDVLREAYPQAGARPDPRRRHPRYRRFDREAGRPGAAPRLGHGERSRSIP